MFRFFGDDTIYICCRSFFKATYVAVCKVNPLELNLRVNPFGSAPCLSTRPDEFEPITRSAAMTTLVDGDDAGLEGATDPPRSDVERIRGARRLTRETCLREKIFFDENEVCHAILQFYFSILSPLHCFF